MEYQLISWLDNGTQKLNDGDTSSFPIIVVVGIVGDTYGFVAPNPQKNMTDVIVPNKLQFDLDQLKEFKNDAAIAFVAETYPSK